MNVLFLATYGDFLATFELSNIKLLQDMGCTVHCASNFTEKEYNRKTYKLDEINVVKHEIEFLRSPIKAKNIIAYKKLLKLIKEENIEMIDCHNAIVGAFARIVAWQCKIDKVVYTPHSFFFYKDCPKKNEFIYKNVEKILARKTDLLITINNEDYIASKKMKVRGEAIYVPGIGINSDYIFNLPRKREEYCKEFNIPIDATIFVSVGELIHRKNHESAIRAFSKANIENAYYLICGIGELESHLKDIISNLGLDNRVKLLGYREDAKDIMKSSDIFIFPSFQEGLPVALMEAMACGLPCLVSKIRGNVDLIDEEKGGLLFDPHDVQGLSEELLKIMMVPSEWGKHNKERIKEFDIYNVQKIMRLEYSNILKKGDKIRYD